MKAPQAVLAASPANMPLQIAPTSTLPLVAQVIASAVSIPAVLESIADTATTLKRTSVAARVEPALKPNQPNARINVPKIPSGKLWAVKLRTVPSRPYFPMRGPSTKTPINAITPPVK